MEQLTIKITGTNPLMMHASTLANPLHPSTKAHKALTAKRLKTEEDHLSIAFSEYIAGCYWNPIDGFHIPGDCISAAFLAGAKLSKLGKLYERGCLVLDTRAKLLHDGASTPEKLWEDPSHVDVRGVGVSGKKIMRYRPIFLDWSTQVTLSINTDVIDIHQVKKLVHDAGALIGLLEYRPRFGRFEVAYV